MAHFFLTDDDVWAVNLDHVETLQWERDEDGNRWMIFKGVDGREIARRMTSDTPPPITGKFVAATPGQKATVARIYLNKTPELTTWHIIAWRFHEDGSDPILGGREPIEEEGNMEHGVEWLLIHQPDGTLFSPGDGFTYDSIQEATEAFQAHHRTASGLPAKMETPV